MASIVSSSSFEDLEAELSEMGFSMSLSDFEKSLQSEETAQQLQQIRGEGITAKNYMSNIRLASELNELKVHQAPMGHMPTSTEILNTTHENEITPLLRKLGICGQDGELSSRRTRMVPKIEEEIKLDRNMPVILNGELFDTSNYYETGSSEEDDDEEEEKDDPNLPLDQRFSTIKEFQTVSIKTQTQPNLDNSVSSLSSYPESSGTSSSSNNPDMSSHSTTADDASSSSSSSVTTNSSTSGTTYSVENQCSSDWHVEPPLLKKGKLYTPRELYEMKNTFKRYAVSRQ